LLSLRRTGNESGEEQRKQKAYSLLIALALLCRDNKIGKDLWILQICRSLRECRFAETQILVSDSCVLRSAVVGDVMISPLSEAVRRKTGFYSIDSLQRSERLCKWDGTWNSWRSSGQLIANASSVKARERACRIE
jgi:hypothetical protein